MSDSFLEIAPGSVTTSISGKSIEVYGLSLKAIASLLMGYPALLDLVFTKGEQKQEITATDVIKVAPDAVADIILYGIKMQGNKKAREIADNLPGGEQVILLSVIIRQSLGEGGFGPLVKHVEKLTEMTGPLQNAVNDVETKAASPQQTNSQSPLNG